MQKNLTKNKNTYNSSQILMCLIENNIFHTLWLPLPTSVKNILGLQALSILIFMQGLRKILTLFHNYTNKLYSYEKESSYAEIQI